MFCCIHFSHDCNCCAIFLPEKFQQYIDISVISEERTSMIGSIRVSTVYIFLSDLIKARTRHILICFFSLVIVCSIKKLGLGTPSFPTDSCFVAYQWATKVLRHFAILEYLRTFALIVSTHPTAHANSHPTSCMSAHAK